MENPPPANPEQPSDVAVESSEPIVPTDEELNQNQNAQSQEQTQMSQSGDKFAYWKTWPGKWKLMQLGFGTIAMICAIIAVIPACNTDPVSKWPEDPIKHKKMADSCVQVTYTETRGGVTHTAKVPLSIDSEGYVQNRRSYDYDYAKKEWSKPKALEPNYTANPLLTACYCSLLQYESEHTEIKIPIWVAFAILTWIVNLIVVYMQWKDNNFVNRMKFPLMIYYGIIWLVIDLASTCGIYNSIWYKIWYEVEVPMFWATIIGSVCGEINAVAHTLAFHWNYIHKMP